MRHQRPVHARQLEFVVEIGARSQAAQHGGAAARRGELGHQALEGFDAHLWAVAQGRARHVHALVQVEKGLFVVGHGHGHYHPVKQLRRTAHQVFMPQGDGVESSGVNGEHVVGHGLGSPGG